MKKDDGVRFVFIGDKSIFSSSLREKMEELESGKFDVFYGPVIDSEGNLRVDEGESMSDDVMLNSFDWYVEGVVIDEE